MKVFLLGAATCLALVAACGTTKDGSAPAEGGSMEGAWVNDGHDAADLAACSTSDQCEAAGGPGVECVAAGINDQQCAGVAIDTSPSCTADLDCEDAGAGEVCAVDPCALLAVAGGYQPAPRCRPACSGALDCESGEVCQAAHCVAPSCRADTDCEPNFQCGVDVTCSRKTCDGDDQCSGYCVDNLCSATPGQCRPAAG